MLLGMLSLSLSVYHTLIPSSFGQRFRISAWDRFRDGRNTTLNARDGRRFGWLAWRLRAIKVLCDACLASANEEGRERRKGKGRGKK